MQDTHGDEARPRSPIRDLSPVVAGLLLGSILFLLAAGALTLLARDGLRQQERDRSEQLRAVAASAAALVEPLAHERLERPGDTGNPDYVRAIGALARFHDTQPSIEWMYTMRVREGRLHYVLDTAHDAALTLPIDRSFASAVMDPVREFYLADEPELLPEVLGGHTHIDRHDYQTGGRWFRSAQAPIRDPAGNVVAMLGVDADTAGFRAARSALLVRSGIALVACLLLAIALGMQEARRRLDSSAVSAP